MNVKLKGKIIASFKALPGAVAECARTGREDSNSCRSITQVSLEAVGRMKDGGRKWGHSQLVSLIRNNFIITKEGGMIFLKAA